MRPLIILLITYTTMLCSFVSGIEVKHSEAFDRVAECIYICTHADNTEENLSVAEVICDAHKVGAPLKPSRHLKKTLIIVKCIYCTFFCITWQFPSDFVFKAVYTLEVCEAD